MSPVEPLDVDGVDVLEPLVPGSTSVVGIHVVLVLASWSLPDPVLPASLSALESVVPIEGEGPAGTHANAYENEVITAAATVERHGQE